MIITVNQEIICTPVYRQIHFCSKLARYYTDNALYVKKICLLTKGFPKLFHLYIKV